MAAGPTAPRPVSCPKWPGAFSPFQLSRCRAPASRRRASRRPRQTPRNRIWRRHTAPPPHQVRHHDGPFLPSPRYSPACAWAFIAVDRTLPETPETGSRPCECQAEIPQPGSRTKLGAWESNCCSSVCPRSPSGPPLTLPLLIALSDVTSSYVSGGCPRRRCAPVVVRLGNPTCAGCGRAAAVLSGPCGRRAPRRHCTRPPPLPTPARSPGEGLSGVSACCMGASGLSLDRQAALLFPYIYIYILGGAALPPGGGLWQHGGTAPASGREIRSILPLLCFLDRWPG